MERQKQIAYQLDLFFEQEGNVIAHSPKSQGVSEDLEGVGSQVTEAGGQERALIEELMQHVLHLNYDKLDRKSVV